MISLRKILLFVLGLGLLGAALYAAAGGVDKAAGGQLASAPGIPATAINDAGNFIFGAPPGDGFEEEVAKYEPIAEHLSRVTGKRFVYRYSADWLSYSKNMAGGVYDVVFDGPAFTGWRIDRMSHTPLVKLPDDVVFVVITRADGGIGQLKHLAGHRVCTVAPPDVGALALLSQFNNPARQPMIVEAKSWQEAHKGLMDGKCTASIMSQRNLETIESETVKVVYRYRPLPNYAFSAGPRIAPEMKGKIRDALLSVSGKTATAKLRASHGAGDFVPATPAEYAGLGRLLKDSLYYQ